MLQTLLLLLAVTQVPQVSQNYLVMQPIQEAVQYNRFAALAPICRPRLTVNLEEPFALGGFLTKGQFIEEFSARWTNLETEKLEWSSLQVEENIAVQSLNLILVNRFSGRKIFYKLIIFMSADYNKKQEKEWKLYYLRGLRI
ncbi:MAG: hypothetical protein WCL37_01400 [Chrysiogenales bacterium]